MGFAIGQTQSSRIPKPRPKLSVPRQVAKANDSTTPSKAFDFKTKVK